MRSLSLSLLGPPEVRRDGAPVTLRTRKTLALLAYLAAEGGLQSRARLSGLLWPASDERRGRTALRSALAGLRRALGDLESATGGEAFVLVEGDLVGLNPAAEIGLDLNALDNAPRPPVVDRQEGIERLSTVARAYRGEFMEGFYLNDAPDFEEWLTVQRESRRRRAVEVLGLLSRLQEESGDLAAAVETAAGRVDLEPFDGAARARLIELRFAAGDRDGALYSYEEYRSKLARDLGTKPDPELQALVRRLRSEPSVRHSARAPGTFRESLSRSVKVPFVGRSEPFAALMDEYRDASEGRTRTVILVGEAGIGKTRLATEVLLWVEAQEEADVLRGRAFEAGVGVPYGPIVDMMRERLNRERAPDDLLDDVWLAELSRLLPELRERYPDLPPPTSDEATAKTRLFEAVAQLGLALARRASPVVLFIDDLQWADRASLELSQYAGRRWVEEEAPVLLVSSVRREVLESDAGLAGWLAGVGRDLPLTRLELGNLGVDDISALLRSVASPSDEPDAAVETGSGRVEELCRWLYRETGGQPFFVVETLRALRDREILVPKVLEDGRRILEISAFDADTLGGALPSGVRDVVRGRLSNLGRASLELLAAGAVLSGNFTFEHLLAVAELEETDGLLALDETLGARLLVEAPGGERRSLLGNAGGLDGASYSFSHDKISEVVYTEAGEARRRIFHRRALETLKDAAPAANLARHALAAGMLEPAFRYSVAAGDAAIEVFAVSNAMNFYERAQVLLSQNPAEESPQEDSG